MGGLDQVLIREIDRHAAMRAAMIVLVADVDEAVGEAAAVVTIENDDSITSCCRLPELSHQLESSEFRLSQRKSNAGN